LPPFLKWIFSVTALVFHPRRDRQELTSLYRQGKNDVALARLPSSALEIDPTEKGQELSWQAELQRLLFPSVFW